MDDLYNLREARLRRASSLRVGIEGSIMSSSLLQFFQQSEDIYANQIIRSVYSATPDVITCMSKKSFNNFCKMGRFLTYAEAYDFPTWHDKVVAYSEVRSYDDIRLFGDRCETQLMHAVAIQQPYPFGGSEGLQSGFVADSLLPYLEKYAGGVESVYVLWEPEVLDFATYTLGDSQQNCFARVWRSTSDSMDLLALRDILNYGVDFGGSRKISRYSKAVRYLLSYPAGCNPYIEFQVHKQVVCSDVMDVFTLDQIRSKYGND